MTLKYISPGGWFSLNYPPMWREFEDTEESFLFYNPDQWTGNFRISAYKDRSNEYGKQCIEFELKENHTSSLVKVGAWDCAYSAETFQEEGAWYTTHLWITGRGNMSFECSFTVPKGGDRIEAETIIKSLQIRPEDGKAPKEIIPIRILEIGEVNAAYEWASTTIKKQLTKDFTSVESDIASIQQVMESGRFKAQQREAWENFGIAFGTILINEMDGMEWVTIIEGCREYPALQFVQSDMVIEPAALVWEKVRKNQTIDLKAEYKRIRREAEALLDDLNNEEE